VSRRFKAATDAQLNKLMSRDLSELDLAGVMLDGVHFADACCVVALAIGADGTRVPVACGWATPGTRPSSPPCSPISSTGP
jgi:putative transposase